MLNDVLQDFISQVLDKAFQNYLNSILNVKENLLAYRYSIFNANQHTPALKV